MYVYDTTHSIVDHVAVAGGYVQPKCQFFGEGVATRSGLNEEEAHFESAPRLIRSVVDQAGLGQFVYLLGKSGRRYVFSSISIEQAALYDHALFAMTDIGSDIVRFGRDILDFGTSRSMFYVHLLDEDREEIHDVICDLTCQVAQ